MAYFLSFWRCSHPAAPGYRRSFGVCQEPGQLYFGGVLPFLHSSFPRAPGATDLPPEALEKMAESREFGRYTTGVSRARWAPGRNLSTGYPHLTRWGVWEFELSALVGRTCP